MCSPTRSTHWDHSPRSTLTPISFRYQKHKRPPPAVSAHFRLLGYHSDHQSSKHELLPIHFCCIPKRRYFSTIRHHTTYPQQHKSHPVTTYLCLIVSSTHYQEPLPIRCLSSTCQLDIVVATKEGTTVLINHGKPALYRTELRFTALSLSLPSFTTSTTIFDCINWNQPPPV